LSSSKGQKRIKFFLILKLNFNEIPIKLIEVFIDINKRKNTFIIILYNKILEMFDQKIIILMNE
jgi:hypothetical protein